MIRKHFSPSILEQKQASAPGPLTMFHLFEMNLRFIRLKNWWSGSADVEFQLKEILFVTELEKHLKTSINF